MGENKFVMTILSHIRWCQLPMKPERKGLTRRDRIITWSQSTAVRLISLFKVAFKQYVISSRILTTLNVNYLLDCMVPCISTIPLYSHYDLPSILTFDAKKQYIHLNCKKKNVQIILNDSVFSFRCSCTKPVNNLWDRGARQYSNVKLWADFQGSFSRSLSLIPILLTLK